MFFFPVNGIVDLNFFNFLREAVRYRYGYPLPALRRLDAVAVLPFIFFILNIIQIAECIGFHYFIKIADPGQILRLMNGNDQFDFSLEVVSKPQIRSKGPACQRDFASDLFRLRCSARLDDATKKPFEPLKSL